MKKSPLALLAAFLLIQACTTRNLHPKIESGVFNPENIAIDKFVLNPKHDTILHCNNGTCIQVDKESFIDENGNVVQGSVDIEVKECLSKIDLVLGHMNTTSDGEILESAGMLYFNASQDGSPLRFADNKSVRVILKTDSVLPEMMLFEVEKVGSRMNWINPVPVDVMTQEKLVVQVPDSFLVPYVKDTIFKQHNVKYKVVTNGGTKMLYPIPDSIERKICDLIFAGDGMLIERDSSIFIDDHEVRLCKQHECARWKVLEYAHRWVKEDELAPKIIHEAVGYSFELKKPGWVNIDRYFDDPRSEEVELTATIGNAAEFENICTSLIFKNQNTFVAGYQRSLNSFEFSQDEGTKAVLPLGEEFVVLATAFKGDQVYVAYEPFILNETQTINLHLVSASINDFRDQLEVLFN